MTVIGPQQGKEQTFALRDAWVQEPNRPDHDEALAMLAERYFRSHGPASVKDFAGWTALNMTEARRAVAAAGESLVTVDVAGTPMVAASAAVDAGADGRAGTDRGGSPDPLVLPGFDEYLLGFKDRSLMAAPEVMAGVIPGGNGIFRNTVVLDGRVVATWTKAVKATRVDITALPLGGWQPGRAVRARLERKFDGFARYLNVAAASVTYAVPAPITISGPDIGSHERQNGDGQ